MVEVVVVVAGDLVCDLCHRHGGLILGRKLGELLVRRALVSEQDSKDQLRRQRKMLPRVCICPIKSEPIFLVLQVRGAALSRA